MAIVSTGQMTIVDSNDARPITAYITPSQGLQQIFSKDESVEVYNPNWTTTANVLTAKVMVGKTGGAEDVTAQLTGIRWSNDLSTSLGSTSTLSINTNLTEATPQKIYYFEADWIDPVTGLSTHIVAQIQLALLKTGTNAVYILTRGKQAIEESNTATKNTAVIAADLMRAAGVDTTGITYRFFEQNGAVQVDNTMTTKYGLKTTAPGASPVGSASDIGVNLPAAAAWSAHNTLVIHESAVADMGVFRIEAKDALGTIYQVYFTIYDVSDPYETKLVSTAGEKLQNGVGSTQVYPVLYNGSSQLSTGDTAAWTFKWIFADKDGNRCGFVDSVRTAQAAGRDISANTAGAGAVLTYSGAAITFAAGDMIKIVTGGSAKYYEVASGTTSSNLTLRTATVSTFLNAAWPAASITANQFAGSKLYVCKGTGATAGTQSTTGSGSANFITVTGEEVDGKGIITCEANRP